eukprot:TRINITY_DN1121_c0_g1_i2.p1 TRINITY_DN1121_c0_g1~~TRINITY_DN1121_c0_g1_i2.p1  ORF type:complete len:366 (-),score=52.91 TRINITY_DN1121_c0_g1_i2:1060-2157(-)
MQRSKSFKGEGGRVEVTVRVRPRLPADGACSQVVVDETAGTIAVGDSPDKCYHFDHVLPPTSSQAHAFTATAAPLVEAILSGVNGAIIAYGQTGAGKTYTLCELAPGRAGIIPRALRMLFDRIENAEERFEYSVKLTYLQIYMDTIQDLLQPERVKLLVREGTNGIYVENLSEHRVRSAGDVLALLELGEAAKMFAQTRLNQHSSRSHCVLTVSVERRDKQDPARVLTGRFTMVDLAGSERAAKTRPEGIALSEAKAINLSLTSLGNVIAALSTRPVSQHIPWRDSKLTRILQDSLNGNARIALVINVAPDDPNVSETVSSLAFGLRAMRVLVRPVVNEEIDYKALSYQLQRRLDAVKSAAEVVI